MGALFRGVVLALSLLGSAIPAFADVNRKTLAEAAQLGLKLGPKWRIDSIEIQKHGNGYPLFIIVSAEDPNSIGDFMRRVFLKKSAFGRLEPAFDFYRNVEIQFSPSGRSVLIQDDALGNFSDTLILPIKAFTGGDGAPTGMDRRLGMNFRGMEAGAVVQLSSIVKATIRAAASKCAHEHYRGTKWISEDKIAVFIEVYNCGAAFNELRNWDCFLNLRTHALEDIQELKR